jgi:hypothetical protein
MEVLTFDVWRMKYQRGSWATMLAFQSDDSVRLR